MSIRPRRLAVAFLAGGIVCLAVAILVLGKELKTADVVYDIGFSILVVTGLTIVIDGYIQRFQDEERRREQMLRERLEADQREREEAARRLRQDYEERVQEIMQDLEAAGAVLDQAKAGVREALREAAISELAANLHDIHEDIRWIRAQVDPRYEHPNMPVAKAIVERMQERLRAGGDDEGPAQPSS